MILYMLYYHDPVGIRWKMGGGSSTRPGPRIYESREKAERARDRYFPRALIKEIDFYQQPTPQIPLPRGNW